MLQAAAAAAAGVVATRPPFWPKKKKKPPANDSLNNALAAFAATALIRAWSSSRYPLQPLPSLHYIQFPSTPSP